jgi:hypothetical protein
MHVPTGITTTDLNVRGAEDNRPTHFRAHGHYGRLGCNKRCGLPCQQDDEKRYYSEQRRGKGGRDLSV